MIHAISPTLEDRQYLVGNPRPLGFRIKNWVFDKISNWRDKIMTVGTVYHLAQAFFFLLGGYFVIAAISVATAALLAKSLRDLKEFANLDKGISAIQEESTKYGLLNLQHKKHNQELERNIEEFKQQVIKLETITEELASERRKFEKSNEEYAYLNTVHQEQIENLKAATTKLVVDIESTLRSGNQVSRDIFSGFLRAAKGLESYEQRVEEVCAKLEDKNTQALEDFKKVTESVKNMTWQGVQVVTEAYNKLAALDAQIAEKQVRLEGVTKQLEEVSRRLDGSSRALDNKINNMPSKGGYDIGDLMRNPPQALWALIALYTAHFAYKVYMGTISA